MKNFRHFEPGEEDLPDGWEPAHDKDDQWLALVGMMREADKPGPVLPARFEAIRMDARAQLLREGVLRPVGPATAAHASADSSFASWLRQLFLGGGLGGQVVRFGAIAALAFYAGSDPRTTTIPTHNVASVAAPTPAAKPNTLIATATPRASVETDSPTGGIEIPKSTFSGGSPVSPSSRDDGWGYPSMTVPVGAAGAASFERSGPSVALDAIDQLQNLKISLTINSNYDKNTLEQINALEDLLARLMIEQQDSKSRAVSTYRQAVELNRAGRHGDAVSALETVARMDPGSSLSMMARFQIGAIAYERLHQYDLALDSFQSCLTEFPGQRLAPEAQEYLAARVRVIKETSEEQWQSLRLWQQVQETADSGAQIEGLIRIVLDTPSALLASESVQQLREMMVADAPKPKLDAAGVAIAIRQRLERGETGVEAAGMWQALGEIYALRLGEPEEAGRAYARAEAVRPRTSAAPAPTPTK